jgi:predicted MPP superfamily phosphohydrolase
MFVQNLDFNYLLVASTSFPAFFIVCGDLVDAFPDNFPEIRDQQVKDLLNVYSKLDKSIPLVCVCGNHDVGKNLHSDKARSSLVRLKCDSIIGHVWNRSRKGACACKFQC